MRIQMMVIAMLGLSACAKFDSDIKTVPSANECAVPQAARARLIAFGDSQSAGLVSKIGDCKFSFAYELADRLSLNIDNQAIGGTSLLAGNVFGGSQFDQIILTQFETTDSVVWLVDYNDVAQYGMDANHLALFKIAFENALALLSAQTSHVYIATGLSTIPGMSTYNYSPAAHALYQDAVTDIVNAAALSNVTLIDSDALFMPEPSDMVGDDIHLNSTAQTVLGDAIFNYIQTH